MFPLSWVLIHATYCTVMFSWTLMSFLATFCNVVVIAGCCFMPLSVMCLGAQMLILATVCDPSWWFLWLSVMCDHWWQFLWLSVVCPWSLVTLLMTILATVHAMCLISLGAYSCYLLSVMFSWTLMSFLATFCNVVVIAGCWFMPLSVMCLGARMLILATVCDPSWWFLWLSVMCDHWWQFLWLSCVCDH